MTTAPASAQTSGCFDSTWRRRRNTSLKVHEGGVHRAEATAAVWEVIDPPVDICGVYQGGCPSRVGKWGVQRSGFMCLRVSRQTATARQTGSLKVHFVGFRVKNHFCFHFCLSRFTFLFLLQFTRVKADKSHVWRGNVGKLDQKTHQKHTLWWERAGFCSVTWWENTSICV